MTEPTSHSELLGFFDQRIGDLVGAFVPGGPEIVEAAVSKQNAMKANGTKPPPLGQIIISDHPETKAAVTALLTAQAAARTLSELKQDGWRTKPFETLPGESGPVARAQDNHNKSLQGVLSSDEAQTRALESLRTAEGALREQGLRQPVEQIRQLRAAYGDDTVPEISSPKPTSQKSAEPSQTLRYSP